MKASVVDLRYHMKDVLKALERNEEVTILYHGKPAGTIIPPKREKKYKRIQDHPLFGMNRKAYQGKTVEQIMDGLRGGRYRDI